MGPAQFVVICLQTAQAFGLFRSGPRLSFALRAKQQKAPLWTCGSQRRAPRQFFSLCLQFVLSPYKIGGPTSLLVPAEMSRRPCELSACHHDWLSNQAKTARSNSIISADKRPTVHWSGARRHLNRLAERLMTRHVPAG